ncbi:MAG: SDR family NAD(P)-dependent oxidoreductase [Actinobacteria bacterium]|nr:SDR family NAD(P)-dependent oxidoreductase [Actinomycetota bacterium]
MTAFDGQVAAVTGAGSGIGRALALELGDRRAKLAISDINAETLAQTAESLRRKGSEVYAQTVDVADAAALLDHAHSVADQFGAVNQIYNNAGIAFSRSILESDVEDYQRVLDINLLGVINGTKAFLPHLIESGNGHVVNISSLNGFLAQGLASHYCAAKFAVRGFTESLNIEMIEGGYPVRVTCVHPGGVRTNIADNAVQIAVDAGYELSASEEARRVAYNDRLLKMSPGEAATTILRGVARNKSRVLVGRDSKGLDFLVRQFPSSYGRTVARVSGRLGLSSNADENR